MLKTGLVLIAAATVGAAAGIASLSHSPASLTGCRAIDGDTIRCGDERIRLVGIDAPELKGHCRPGRTCVSGDAVASRTSLADAMKGSLHIERHGTDRYGRTLATVKGLNGDLSCWQISQDQAVYKPGWDAGQRIAASCPRTAR